MYTHISVVRLRVSKIENKNGGRNPIAVHYDRFIENVKLQFTSERRTTSSFTSPSSTNGLTRASIMPLLYCQSETKERNGARQLANEVKWKFRSEADFHFFTFSSLRRITSRAINDILYLYKILLTSKKHIFVTLKELWIFWDYTFL